MATYQIPTDLSGDVITVNEGDVFIFGPGAETDVSFQSATGQPTGFEIRFEGDNANAFDITIESELTAAITIPEDVTMDGVYIDARDSDGTKLTIGDNVTLNRFDGSNSGSDTVEIGDNFTSINIFKTNGANDSITIGEGASAPNFNMGSGTDAFRIADADTKVSNAEIEMRGDGVVDGTAGGDEMSPGYADAQGDAVDGADGHDDIILGYSGADTIDGGKGDDKIKGGADDDVILASAGSDTVDGGTGTDTYDASAGSTLADGSIDVTIDGTGAGTVDKSGEGTTDTVTGIETFVADEAAGQSDSFTLTDGVAYDAITGMNDSAVGTFTSAETGKTYEFGGQGQPTINHILSGSYDPGTGPVSPVGSYDITSGEEDGAQIGNFSVSNFENVNFSTVVCFARGTRIATERGEVRIEELAVGDRVQTLDNGMRRIRWIGSTTVPARGQLAPILIRQGALGNTRDLLVSPLHRVLLSGWRLELMLGSDESLVPAKFLVNDRDILRRPGGTVQYFHLLFDRHEIIFSEGIPTESFHPGELGMGSLPEASREEIFALFPELRTDKTAFAQPARPTLKLNEARLLRSGPNGV